MVSVVVSVVVVVTWVRVVRVSARRKGDFGLSEYGGGCFASLSSCFATASRELVKNEGSRRIIGLWGDWCQWTSRSPLVGSRRQISYQTGSTQNQATTGGAGARGLQWLEFQNQRRRGRWGSIRFCQLPKHRARNIHAIQCTSCDRPVITASRSTAAQQMITTQTDTITASMEFKTQSI